MSTFVETLRSRSPSTPLPLGSVPFIDKSAWILEKVPGKSVLHIGPTDSPATLRSVKSGTLLHLKLQGKCRELVGLDLDRDCIEALKPFGVSDILHGDAEKLEETFGDKKFDLIIAGDVIEHVNNLGLLLAGAKRVLAPNGKLIITTPNALAVKRVLGAVILREERNNPDHMYFFSPMNLWQAATRFDFEITEFCSFMYRAPGDRMNAIGNAGAKLIMRLTGNYLLADELAVVFQPKKNS